MGLTQLPLVGQALAQGDPLVTVHAASEEAWQAARQRLLDAMVFDGDERLPDVVVGHVG